MMNHDEIKAALMQAAPAELIDILLPVLQARSEIVDGTEIRLVLGEMSRDVDGSGEGQPWNLELVSAPSNPEKWTTYRQQGYWESGWCPTCSVAVVSYAKEAICPLCSRTVGLT